MVKYIDMAYSFRHTDPELTGIIRRERVKCGKKNCCCVISGKLHGDYFYLYWRDYKNGGGLKKQYIPRDKVEKLRQQLKAVKDKDMEEKRIFKSEYGAFLQLVREEIKYG